MDFKQIYGTLDAKEIGHFEFLPYLGMQRLLRFGRHVARLVKNFPVSEHYKCTLEVGCERQPGQHIYAGSMRRSFSPLPVSVGQVWLSDRNYNRTNLETKDCFVSWFQWHGSVRKIRRRVQGCSELFRPRLRLKSCRQNMNRPRLVWNCNLEISINATPCTLAALTLKGKQIIK